MTLFLLFLAAVFLLLLSFACSRCCFLFTCRFGHSVVGFIISFCLFFFFCPTYCRCTSLTEENTKEAEETRCVRHLPWNVCPVSMLKFGGASNRREGGETLVLVNRNAVSLATAFVSLYTAYTICLLCSPFCDLRHTSPYVTISISFLSFPSASFFFFCKCISLKHAYKLLCWYYLLSLGLPTRIVNRNRRVHSF